MPLLLLLPVFKFYNVKINLLLSTKSFLICILFITFVATHAPYL